MIYCKIIIFYSYTLLQMSYPVLFAELIISFLFFDNTLPDAILKTSNTFK